ncbi:MAG: hypothetical protein FWE80_09870 [Oscillospiraceae bacterium]|nr:hypothetical protein [Oscillospiraceae bacterium]
MKKCLSILLALFLSFSLAACTPESDSPVPDPAATTGAGPAPTNPAAGGSDLPAAPAGATELGEKIFYYGLYQLEEEPGDGLTPMEGADLAIVNILSSSEIIHYLDREQPDNCIYIAFDEMETLDSANGRECYIYSVATGTVSGGFQGNGYEVQLRVSADYQMGTVAIYEDYRGGGNVVPDDPKPSWQGTYYGSGHTMNISEYNGKTFLFTVVNDGMEMDLVCDGAAAVSPDNLFIAEYGQMMFALSEDSGFIDFFVAEDTEFYYLHGRYTRQ